MNPSDVKWKTRHCHLTFEAMGIWAPAVDGSHINAVDVSVERGLILTADDDGDLNLLNYPSVVKHAPRKRYNGHSSHVMNVRVMSGGTLAATAGGSDGSIVLWLVTESPRADIAKKLVRRDYENVL